MKNIRLAPLAALLLFALPLLSPPASLAAKRLRSTADGRTLTLEQLVYEVGDARVILFGERHDDADDHAGQRTLLQALRDAGVKVALGLEPIHAESQAKLDEWISGKLPPEGLEELFAREWSAQLYPLYAPLFYYARQERIPLVGLNIPRELSAKVAREGIDSLSEAEQKRIGPVSCNMDEAYLMQLARLVAEKKWPATRFTRFCEAQALWDASMAASVAAFLKKNPGYTVLVIAGTFHAWRYGIPARLIDNHSIDSKVILPEVDPKFGHYRVIDEEADYIWDSN